MTDIYETTDAALGAWRANLETLIQHLIAADQDASREDVFVLLIQGLGFFGGPEGPMILLFPVVDAIKSRIDSSDLEGALRQAIIFRKQLDEVVALVRGGDASAGQGVQVSPTIPADAEDAP